LSPYTKSQTSRAVACSETTDMLDMLYLWEVVGNAIDDMQ
jgi:hypothetical protein